MSLFKSPKTYLDYASGAQMHKEVSLVMKMLLNQNLANPSSMHFGGLKAKKILESSREDIAKTIGSHTDEIIFTGSGTESIALALIGTVYSAKKQFTIPHIITSTIEHSSVLETCKMLQNRGLAEVTFLEPYDKSGVILAQSVKNAVKENTVIVSLAMVNSEIGVIQPVEEYIKILNKIKEEKYNIKSMHFTPKSFFPYLHLDACQAYAHLDLSPLVRKGVDLITFNSIKIGGPSGVGALFKKRSILLEKTYAGGDQEMSLRPGTVSPLLATGFAVAAKKNSKDLSENEEKYKNLKKYLLEQLNKIDKEYKFVFIENSNNYSIPSIVNISFAYFKGDHMAIELDARGIMVSSKSACKSDEEGESYVITELRKKDENDTYKSYGSIRISFGSETKQKDIIKFIKSTKDILRTYRSML